MDIRHQHAAGKGLGIPADALAKARLFRERIPVTCRACRQKRALGFLGEWQGRAETPLCESCCGPAVAALEQRMRGRGRRPGPTVTSAAAARARYARLDARPVPPRVARREDVFRAEPELKIAGRRAGRK